MRVRVGRSLRLVLILAFFILIIPIIFMIQLDSIDHTSTLSDNQIDSLKVQAILISIISVAIWLVYPRTTTMLTDRWEMYENASIDRWTWAYSRLWVGLLEISRNVTCRHDQDQAKEVNEHDDRSFAHHINWTYSIHTGVPVKLTAQEEIDAQKSIHHYGFNMVASDKISLDRRIKDTRPSE
jgi:hypothetical protein